MRRRDKFLTQILTRSQRHNEKGLAVVQLTLLFDLIFEMPRHRIELWTRGFSVGMIILNFQIVSLISRGYI